MQRFILTALFTTMLVPSALAGQQLAHGAHRLDGPIAPECGTAACSRSRASYGALSAPLVAAIRGSDGTAGGFPFLPAQHSIGSRVLSAIGGAAVGAGIGYFASQVVRGDWDEEPGRSEVNRTTWAGVAGSIGLAVGFSFPLGGRPSEATSSGGLPGGRRALDASEIRRKGIANAYEAVRLLRPEWFNERGTHIIGETSDETIEVYLDDVRLGGTPFLRDVDASIIASLHFLDAAAATLRWGSGHSHGVILVVASDGSGARAPGR